MKKIITGSLILLLSGCASLQPNLIINKPVVLQPPANIVKCPLDPLPDHFKSNKNVAQFMLRTYDNNVQCKLNMDGIKKYYKNAEEKLK